MLAKCCWVAAHHRPILKHTHAQVEIFHIFISLLFSLCLHSNHVSFLSLEMSSSSCQVILLPLSLFFSVVWLPRPMVIFPALFAPLTIVLDSVLRGVQGKRRNLMCAVSASRWEDISTFPEKKQTAETCLYFR